MPISFLIGRAGTGKTHHCRSALVRELKARPEGPPLFWILPRQSTFSAERELTVASGLRGFCRAHVMSFDMLGHAILRDAGGVRPAVTSAGRQMILGHLLRQNQPKLKFFSGVAHQLGMAVNLEATLSELERSAVEPEKLLETLRTNENQLPRALADKLHDIHLIYQAYRDYLGQDRLDQHLRLIQVLQRLESSRLFRDATVYVDGFVRFTPYERAILAKVAKICRQMVITLELDPASPLLAEPDVLPEELSLFHPVETTLRELFFEFKHHHLAVDWPPAVLTETHRFATPALRAIERHAFDVHAPPAQKDHAGISFFEANNRQGEAEAAARQIADLVGAGLRYRDIVLLVRDLEAYHDCLACVFAEHGIPYFLDRRRKAWHHPLLALVRQALTLAEGKWDHQALMSLLKGGLCGATAADADLLENYLLRHRLYGSAWTDQKPWQYHRARRWDRDATPDDAAIEQNLAAQESAAADKLRRMLVARLMPLVSLYQADAKVPVHRAVHELLVLQERFDVRQQMTRWIASARAAGQPEAAGEHEQVWSNMIELLDQLVDLLGDEPLKLGDLQQIIESALEGFDLAITPPTVDQVLIGQVDRTRAAEAPVVMVLGLAEGWFPKSAHEDSMLSDSDRRALTQRQLQIDPGATRRLLDESLLGYIALTRARQQLWLSRPIGDDKGKPLAASTYWTRLRQMFPDAPLRAESHSAGLLDTIATPRQLIADLMLWARTQENRTTEQNEAFGALYEWFRQTGRHDPRVAPLAARAWPALMYRNPAAITAETALHLFGNPLTARARQLEDFAACPFKHFLQYGLRLSAREDGELSPVDLAGAYRRVLADLVRDMLQRGENWSDVPEIRRHEFIHEMCQRVGEELRGEILLSTARNRYLLDRVGKNLQLVAANQAAIQIRGQFRPLKSDVTFGPHGSQPPLKLNTPGGHELQLSGEVDRIDVITGQAQAMFAVIDYRMRQKKLALDEVLHGLSLELIANLLAVQASHLLPGKMQMIPVGAFYMELLRDLREVKHPDDAAQAGDPDFYLDAVPRGILDQEAIEAFDTDFTAGSSKVVHVSLTKAGQPKAHSDTATQEQFAALLQLVEKRLAQLTDEILSGSVLPRPYLKQSSTPCTHCGYQPVCRFDKSINGYNRLQSIGRQAALQQICPQEAP